MIKISITGIEAASKELEAALAAKIARVADETLVDVRANTPIKTGNARRNWVKSVTEKSFEVSNSVPYIERLEAGASKQAPRGIIGPTLAQIKGKI